MIINRKEFIKHFNGIKDGLGNPTSVLWIPEEYLKKNQCRWFIKVRPLNIETTNRVDYHIWCKKHCTGEILCYSSNKEGNEEWWGFTHHADIITWILRWT